VHKCNEKFSEGGLGENHFSKGFPPKRKMILKELVIATGNAHKVEEISDMLDMPGLVVRSLADVGAELDVVEDGETFRDNALIKARAAVQMTGLPTLADDSGLEVDALGGRPGVRSSRFAHEQATDAENNAHLLELLDAVVWEERTARFRCVMALVVPDEKEQFVEGVCEGIIDLAEKGSYGFGYDPLFFVPAYNKTLGELGPAVKNKISHRAKAVEALHEILMGQV
jgi:XTP/dITP diphosphohydrolase